MDEKKLIGRLISEADNCDDFAPYDCPNVSTELREAADAINRLSTESQTLSNNYDKANMRYCRQLVEIERLTAEYSVLRQAAEHVVTLYDDSYHGIANLKKALESVSGTQSKSELKRLNVQQGKPMSDGVYDSADSIQGIFGDPGFPEVKNEMDERYDTFTAADPGQTK